MCSPALNIFDLSAFAMLFECMLARSVRMSSSGKFSMHLLAQHIFFNGTIVSAFFMLASLLLFAFFSTLCVIGMSLQFRGMLGASSRVRAMRAEIKRSERDAEG